MPNYSLCVTKKIPDQLLSTSRVEGVCVYALDKDEENIYNTYAVRISPAYVDFCKEYLLFRFGHAIIDELKDDDRDVFFIWTTNEKRKCDGGIRFIKSSTIMHDVSRLSQSLCNVINKLISVQLVKVSGEN